MSHFAPTLIAHALAAYLVGVLIGASGLLPTPPQPGPGPASLSVQAVGGPGYGR